MVFLFRFVFLIWVVFSIQFFFGFDFSRFGILPRTTYGLIGILTAPMIHGSSVHIISNTVPLLFLGWTLFFFYENICFCFWPDGKHQVEEGRLEGKLWCVLVVFSTTL